MDEVTRFLCDSRACLRARGSLPLGTLKVTRFKVTRIPLGTLKVTRFKVTRIPLGTLKVTRFKVTRIEVPVTREEAQDKVGLPLWV